LIGLVTVPAGVLAGIYVAFWYVTRGVNWQNF
jgi:hypothetical protein